MLMKQSAGLQLPDFMKRCCAVLLLCIGFAGHVNFLDASSLLIQPQKITYYLVIDDFAESFIEIPTSILTDPTSTDSSSYLAGKAPIYDANGISVGTCSASFLSIKSIGVGALIYTDISNYITSDDGLIVTWFTPTTLVNLELDSVINGMVTECMVTVTTKVGVAPLYGQTFSLVVSSSGGRIYFQFTRTGMIF